MKKYRVYGVHVASNKAWDESVYDEVIRANKGIQKLKKNPWANIDKTN